MNKSFIAVDADTREYMINISHIVKFYSLNGSCCIIIFNGREVEEFSIRETYDQFKRRFMALLNA